MMNSTCPRLIEVALPIREISAESVRDKSLRHGHVSNLHLWWARRPLSASRAIVFASLVPDPDHPNCPLEFRKAVDFWLKDSVPSVLKGYRRGRILKNDPDPYRPYPDISDTPRNRLLTFIAKWSPEWLAFERLHDSKQPSPAEILDDRSLIKWETSDPKNEQGIQILNIARELIRIANPENISSLLDPFSGGGAIPLEALRLGCQAVANDYNPVAYIILRGTCEFPQKYGKPGDRLVERFEYGHLTQETIKVGNILAYDVEHWAKWVIEQTRKKIGYLYSVGKDSQPVIGYLWARTAPCSNPSCRAEIPLLRTFIVCDKPGKRIALQMNVREKNISFEITKNNSITRSEGTMISGGDCRCPVCGQITPVEDIRLAGLEGKLSERMVAIITTNDKGKDYRAVEENDLDAYEEANKIAKTIEHPGEYIVPEINAPNAPSDSGSHRSISVDIYGFKTFGSLFNSRQLVAMQTFTSYVREAIREIEQNGEEKNYSAAIATYLGLWVSRIASFQSSLSRWRTTVEAIASPFGVQAIPMVWDYVEIDPLSKISGGDSQLEWITKFIDHESPINPIHSARVICGDGSKIDIPSSSVDVIVTDPPYFDSIAYADLSDFFYVWLKRSLGETFPDVFVTPQTPKSEEAVAHKHRHHGDREKGKAHFQHKLAECFAESKRVCKPTGIIAIMFAHQSTEAWSALIDAIFEADLNVVATFPIDTERGGRMVALDTAALASSITVICRQREKGKAASFRDVRKEVEQTVIDSVHRFWNYGFRGADLIVACYGPAVGVFGRYSLVERADGAPVGVPELLELVKRAALKAIAGEFTGDPLSRLYFVWANLYSISDQAWDDARLVVQMGGDSEDALQIARNHDLFVVDGSICRLALLRDRAQQRHLGDEPTAPLIDQLHKSMLLWKQEHRTELVQYLKTNNLTDNEPFWKLAQALFEVLPRGEEDWKLISALLGERGTLKQEVRRSEPPKGPEQLSLI